jgi:hypothetical protein
MPMPEDRAAASYQIYSSLVPLGETATAMWPHSLWLIQDTTITSIPDNQPCFENSNQRPDSAVNPHSAVQPTNDRLQDFSEILEDFDHHCHDHVLLEAAKFKLSGAIRLLNKKEQEEFQSTRMGPDRNNAVAAKYSGAPALYAFSEVYFNRAHTAALVYATHWCGSLCGQGFWVAFALTNGRWKTLPWNSVSWIS